MRLTDAQLLRAGRGVVAIEGQLLALAGVRAHFAPFLAGVDEPTVVVRRGRVPEGGFELNGPDRPFGRFQVEGPDAMVDIDDDPFAALAAARLGFHLAVVRHGGVLLHASGVAFGSKAVVAIGQSGAGKSTLARLLVNAGGELLSDEILALFEDGAVYGTPFFSDYAMPGSAARRELSLAVALHHGTTEELRDISPVALLQTAASQLFRPSGGELTLTSAVPRLTRALSLSRSGTLSFRPIPKAGTFVRELVDAPAPA